MWWFHRAEIRNIKIKGSFTGILLMRSHRSMPGWTCMKIKVINEGGNGDKRRGERWRNCGMGEFFFSVVDWMKFPCSSSDWWTKTKRATYRSWKTLPLICVLKGSNTHILVQKENKLKEMHSLAVVCVFSLCCIISIMCWNTVYILFCC